MSKLKIAALLMVALFLCSLLADAARPGPAFTSDSPAKIEGAEAEQAEAGVAEESCEGIGGEECLARRTLAAHVDYIYTQKHKP
uniref:Phytosulfokine n=1 Tax=Rhizophora mucronata TaxID=61149 RepID=A0A2P2N1P5_RHIMU